MAAGSRVEKTGQGVPDEHAPAQQGPPSSSLPGARTGRGLPSPCFLKKSACSVPTLQLRSHRPHPELQRGHISSETGGGLPGHVGHMASPGAVWIQAPIFPRSGGHSTAVRASQRQRNLCVLFMPFIESQGGTGDPTAASPLLLPCWPDARMRWWMGRTLSWAHLSFSHA